MKVCFIGHKTINKREELTSLLKETVISFLKRGIDTFLFGSMSAFNDLSWEVVTELKKDYPYIKRIYVRSSYQYISKSYEDYLLKFYEETYFPQKIKNAGKYAYIKRNYEMIDNSTYCVFYYNKNYIPSKRPSKHNMLPSSGTKIAYEYATKKRKEIINLYQ